jgi:hypothetical protein
MNPLKKITLTQKNKHGSLLLLIFFCLGFNSLKAQVQNNGVLYIGDNANLFVQSGDYNFGTGSTTVTSTTASIYGKLQLGASATTSGAATGAGLFVNGYATTFSNSYFVLPTGQTTTYAPIGITNATVTSGVSAAFTLGTPANSANLDATISALYNVGSWKVVGDNAKITLIWNSDISTLTNSIANLTVAGYNTSRNKWELISSATPTGNLTAGTIQTSSNAFLLSYSAFTLAKRGISCATIPSFAIAPAVTWAAGIGWSSTPSITSVVTVYGSGSPGSFDCYSLDVTNGSQISFTNGQTVTVATNITGSGLIKLASEASVYQMSDLGSFSPQVEITKSARNGMYAYDYIYWGSPLKSTENTFALLSSAQAYNTANTVSTGAVGALDNFYKYVGGDTTTAGGWQSLTTNPDTGTGFITRIKQQAPFATFGTQNLNSHINLKFTGATNNGYVTVPIANDLTSPTSDRNFNFFGNPYPSAIDADKFLEYNTDLDGAVYIWKATTPATGVAGYSYGKADYIAYTRAGSTAEAGVSASLFNGKIATGQGFRVKVATASGTGTATFNNCMRVAGSNDQFNKTGTINRYKLNLAGADNIGNQILVAYMPQTTLAYDRMYDAEISSVSPAQLYSLLDNTSTQLSINARPTFSTLDVVALGIDKSNATAENFSIGISDKEGIFQGTAINVLLHDKLLHIYQNLSNGAYNFTSNSAQLQGRFEIVYQEAALGTDGFDTSNVIATLSNQALKITASLPITSVMVYDVAGRLVTNLTIDNLQQVNQPFPFANGVYIVKIKLNNGAIATQKLLNH